MRLQVVGCERNGDERSAADCLAFLRPNWKLERGERGEGWEWGSFPAKK